MTATAPHRRDQAATDRRPRDDAPIVAAVDASASGAAAAREAIPIAKRLGARVVFVYVRSGPLWMRGEPYHQRRLDAETLAARRLIEFARLRGARMVVLGPRPRRRFRRSVSRRVIGGTDRPVLLADATSPAAA